ncbi:MAG: ABC transporter substrate-binding protein [Acidimicrobiia bacterium]|nr:ABC transporter substrate-binding protein [Acidimicrobiia bacterium]
MVAPSGRPPSTCWHRHALVRSAALVAVLGLAGAACGSGDSENAGEGGDRGARTTTTVDEGEPVPGGTLVYGIEADTASAWTPQSSLCAISCHTIMKSVFDTLAVVDADGVAQPFLAEAVEPNADFTEWTIIPRAGVAFHDGTPFDAAAICFNLQAAKDSALQGRALVDVATVAPSTDGAGCVVTMTRPWTTFDYSLTGQTGYMASPAWLASALTDPTAAGRPVGTGPFVFESYSPGNGGSFIANKNPDYWRADEGLPYLDRVEFRVLQDIESRENALRDGAVNIIHTANTDVVAGLREEADLEMHEDATYGETAYAMLNVGDPESEVADVRVRRALAMAVDPEQFNDARNAGIGVIANGPFSPDQVGYLEDNDAPEFDPEGATALIEEYEAETGRPVEIDFLTTADPFNLQTNELVAAAWEAVGISVNLNTVDQGQYIVQAALGNFEAFAWRNHGGYTPDQQRIWWHSEASRPIGDISTTSAASRMTRSTPCSTRSGRAPTRPNARRWPRTSTASSPSRPTTCGSRGPSGPS